MPILVDEEALIDPALLPEVYRVLGEKQAKKPGRKSAKTPIIVGKHDGLILKYLSEPDLSMGFPSEAFIGEKPAPTPVPPAKTPSSLPLGGAASKELREHKEKALQEREGRRRLLSQSKQKPPQAVVGEKPAPTPTPWTPRPHPGGGPEVQRAFEARMQRDERRKQILQNREERRRLLGRIFPPQPGPIPKPRYSEEGEEILAPQGAPSPELPRDDVLPLPPLESTEDQTSMAGTGLDVSRAPEEVPSPVITSAPPAWNFPSWSDPPPDEPPYLLLQAPTGGDEEAASPPPPKPRGVLGNVLDFLNPANPSGQAMLALSMGLLGGTAPGGDFGNIAGRAGLGALQTWVNAKAAEAANNMARENLRAKFELQRAGLNQAAIEALHKQRRHYDVMRSEEQNRRLRFQLSRERNNAMLERAKLQAEGSDEEKALSPQDRLAALAAVRAVKKQVGNIDPQIDFNLSRLAAELEAGTPLTNKEFAKRLGQATALPGRELGPAGGLSMSPRILHPRGSQEWIDERVKQIMTEEGKGHREALEQAEEEAREPLLEEE